MASKWNKKPCPLCSEGTLHDGTQKKTLEYRGRSYDYTVNGAFCDHCLDGFPNHNEQEELAWQSFRDKVDAEEAAELARIRKNLNLPSKKPQKLQAADIMRSLDMSVER